MLWCQEKIKIIAAMYREARHRAQSLIHTIKNLDQGLVRKKIEKIPVKKQELEVNTRSTCEMKLIGQKFTKGRNERNQKGKRV